MLHRPRLLLGVALALGSRLAGKQIQREAQPKPETQKAPKQSALQRWTRHLNQYLTERRRWLIRWAPNGGGLRERLRRQRQIAAGTLNASNGLLPFNKN